MARLIIPFRNGRHGWYEKTVRPGIKGWLIDDIAFVLQSLVANYEQVGERKPAFTRAEVRRLVYFLLYKEFDVGEAITGKILKQADLRLRQRTFLAEYVKSLGKGAASARAAGYSPKRARQTAWDLLHPRKRYG
jgi:hypothetical protein